MGAVDDISQSRRDDSLVAQDEVLGSRFNYGIESCRDEPTSRLGTELSSCGGF